MRMSIRLGLASLEKALDAEQPAPIQASGYKTSSPSPSSQKESPRPEDRPAATKKPKAA